MPKSTLIDPKKRQTLTTITGTAISLFALNSTLQTAMAESNKFNLKTATAPRILGNPDAPVTMIEYASMTCGHCAKFHATILPTLKKDYIDTGKVKLEFHDFPLDGIALGVSMLLRCLPENRYFQAMDVLFKQQQTWARSNDPIAKVESILRLAGLTPETANACKTSAPLQDFVIQSRLNGTKKHKVSATPTVIIGDTTFGGVYPLNDYINAIKSNL